MYSYQQLALIDNKEKNFYKKAFLKWCKEIKKDEKDGNKILFSKPVIVAISILKLYQKSF